jgi:hypothetical protein
MAPKRGRQFVAKYTPETMDWTVNKDLLKPGNSEAPDWDEHYNKSFRWGHVPKENWTGPEDEWHEGQVGLVANFGDDFTAWKDAHDHPAVQEWKQNWAEKWKTIPAYKQNQILAAVNATNRGKNGK